MRSFSVVNIVMMVAICAGKVIMLTITTVIVNDTSVIVKNTSVIARICLLL
jgi:hypothetical protein